MNRARPAWLFLLAGLAGAAQAQPAAGQFLVAARGLSDPNFQRCVVLLVQHDERGSWGLVINRPTAVPLSRLFGGELAVKRKDGLLYSGGPVSPESFLLLLRSSRRPAESRHVFADVYLALGPKALRDERAVLDSRIYAGYAGWAAGQLEAEITRGDWRLLPAEAPRVFDEHPERTWEELARRLEAPVAAGRALEVSL